MLEDKVILITGGGHGMGRASAIAFAGYGAKVAVADINQASAEETARHIADAGGEAIAIGANVTVEAEVAAMVEQTVSRFGRLNCAFNQAGGTSDFAAVTDLELAHWQANLDLNLIG